MTLKKGFVHVYTGNGKGKTTAAIGLGIRAIGAGLKVIMIQFMKGRQYSELETLAQIKNFTVMQFGRDEFVSKDNPEQIDIDLAYKGLAYAKDIIKNGEYDLVILDEINVAVDFHLIPLKEVILLVANKPEPLELVLTGRYASPELIQHADLVSEILEIKHPFQKGVVSRKGIDW